MHFLLPASPRFCYSGERKENTRMMGQPQPQKDLFSYHVDLNRRVRPDHPLRAIKTSVDFLFVREEVAHCYGHNGNESVPPEVILKLMFLLFYENLPSERELMRILPERLDYLWFLDYSLDEAIPDHSVLSKARKRWGAATFEAFFVRTVRQCVEAGLVPGSKLHVDGSLNEANASCDSVQQTRSLSPEALKALYASTEAKLADTEAVRYYKTVNDQLVSTTDPDAAVVHKGHEPSRPRYQHHRAVDDAHGVITAVETTPGSIAENKKLLGLIEQHQHHTGQPVATVVADSKYGTSENYIACQQRGLITHMGDLRAKQNHARSEGIFPESAFAYDAPTNPFSATGG
jgi:transposase